jgi:hypothetical protein
MTVPICTDSQGREPVGYIDENVALDMALGKWGMSPAYIVESGMKRVIFIALVPQVLEQSIDKRCVREAYEKLKISVGLNGPDTDPRWRAYNEFEKGLGL